MAERIEELFGKAVRLYLAAILILFFFFNTKVHWGWAIFGGLAIYMVLRSLINCFAKWEMGKKPCKHQFQGGLTRGCPECLKEQNTLMMKAEKARAEAANIIYMRDFAKLVYAEEVQKLHQHNCENLDYLQNKISPRDFENVVADLFEKQGYAVEQTPYVNDGGKDIILRKNGQVFFVECKQHSDSNTVGRPMLQKLVGAMHGFATKGFFVTTGTFTSSAVEYAKITNIELINQSSLVKMFQMVNQPNKNLTVQVACLECSDIVVFRHPSYGTVHKCRNGHSVTNNIEEFPKYIFQSSASSSGTRKCQLCGSPMRSVKGRNGRFWGCTSYPRCKYTTNKK